MKAQQAVAIRFCWKARLLLDVPFFWFRHAASRLHIAARCESPPQPLHGCSLGRRGARL